jgi:glutamyl-tRNA reductase
MRILVVGLNHKTAAVELREKLAFDPAAAARAIAELRGRRPGTEAVVVSTCNRVELYVAGPVASGIHGGEVIDFLAGFHGLPRDAVAGAMFVHDHEEAVRHLFRVAAGLDSMVLGEYQIVNQLKESYNAAALSGATGKVFNRLFKQAFEVAKEVRNRTAIGAGKVSVSSVAVDLVRQIFDDFSDKTVLLLGAGKMSELTVRHLMELGVRRIQVCNRSAERGAGLAGRYGAVAVPFADLYSHLVDADIVVSSTGAREPVIRAAPFADVVSRRRGRTMFLIDIAVPRDIEPGVGEHGGVYLYDIDDLNGIVARNLDSRTREIVRCQELIESQIEEFFRWFDSRDVGPLIGRVQEQFRRVCAAELDRLRPKLTGDREADWALIEQTFQRTINKLLHVPIEQFKAAARGSDAGPMTALFKKLFDIQEA